MVFNGSHYDNIIGKTSIIQIGTGMNFLEHNDDGDSNKGSDSDIGGDNGETVHENSHSNDGENGVDEDSDREENDSGVIVIIQF